MKVTYWSERRRCKRPGCQACPHGPYWAGRVDGRRVYFGTFDPRPQAGRPGGIPPSAEELAAAYAVLGINANVSRPEAEYAYAVALANMEGGRGKAARRRVLLRLAWETVVYGKGW